MVGVEEVGEREGGRDELGVEVGSRLHDVSYTLMTHSDNTFLDRHTRFGAIITRQGH